MPKMQGRNQRNIRCARLKVKEGVCLAPEARRRAEEEEHTWIEAEEEARLVEEKRLKAEEEEEDVRLNAEEEA